jgi:hypothetical protein
MSLRAGRLLSVASNRLLAGDVSRALIVAPAAGEFLRIFSILGTCVTAAAQQIYVGVSAGTVAQQILSIPSGATTPVDYWSDAGFIMPEATALTAVPAGAGPAWQFLIEYTIEKTLA